MTAAPLDVAVVGSGYMGGGIAQVLALAGHRVRVADVDAETASKNRDRLIREASAFAAAGLFPDDAEQRVADGITASASIEAAVDGVDAVEEAVPERLDLKRSILARIGAAAHDDALIGSNTSTISIGTLAEAVPSPGRFLGVHFSNPAPFIPGVELIAHASTSDDAVGRAEDLVRSTGKSSARVGDVTGFVLNRLQYALLAEAIRLADEGVATPADIDTIARTTFGFRLPFFGPFAIADMAGLDVYRMCFEQLHDAYGERFAVPASLERLVEQGHLGAKAAGGFRPESGELADALVAYRTTAYGRLAGLIGEIGPSPLDR